MSEPKFAPMPTIPPGFVSARLGYVSPAYHVEVRDRLQRELDELRKAVRDVIAWEWGDPAKGYEVAPSWFEQPEAASSAWQKLAALLPERKEKP